MKGWSLEYVRGLDADEYEELAQWLNESANQADPDSTDADAIVAARMAKDRKRHGRS